MSHRRNPFTPCGAWHEAARLLSEGGYDGWEVMAEIIGKPVSTIRKYGDPGRSPPGDDMVAVDKALKARGHSPVCTIAMGEAIGDHPDDMVARLNDGAYKLSAIIGMLQSSSRAQAWDPLEAMRIGSRIANQAAAFAHSLCLRLGQDLAQKKDLERERPKLRAIGD